jgi:anti-sigma regulatory factor (Ser/Thr protein kinase)
LQTDRLGNTESAMSLTETAETVFPAVPESIGAARRFTRAALRRHAISPETIDIAILLVSELATNALIHAVGDIRVRIRVDAEIRVEVWDASSDGPTRVSASWELESGRGIELVSSLAQGWDWAPRDEGKVVWFALDRRAGTS